MIKRSGWINCIYLVAAAPLLLASLPDDFVSLFTAIFTFMLTDEEWESGRLLGVDNILLPLYYPGDAYYLDNKNEIITRMQCYKL